MDDLLKRWRHFFKELKRRNIYKVAVVYAITGWVLVQVASIATDTFGAPPWVMKMIIFGVLLGFPLVLIFTWAFEITPEGVKRTETKDSTQQLSERTFWIGTGLVTVFLLGGWWYVTIEASENSELASRQITDRSIAVLPLQSVSENNEPLPLAEGLHVDLINRLSNISDLRVKSRTSVMKFQDINLSAPEIADSVGARWIMDGSVQKGGNTVQINVQLIDPSTDTPKWSDTYRRDLTANNIFAIQGEITRQIADALQAQLTAGEQERIAGAPTRDLDAYRYYIQGRQEFAQRNFGEITHIEEAVRYFKQAIRQDSSFALAWTGLADAASFLPYTLSDIQLDIGTTAEDAARKALQLEPDLAEAHASLGFVHFQNMNAPLALRELQKAIELKPSYWEAHHWIGELYLLIGYPQEALDHLAIAVELNPKHALARHWLYDTYAATGQYEKSLREARLQQDMGLEFSGAVAAEVRALYQLGRLQEAGNLAREQIESTNTKAAWKKWFRAYLVQILSARAIPPAHKNISPGLKRLMHHRGIWPGPAGG